jgi:sigma-B regulation protein RsbU (phosphoserine phosphatase)
MTTVPLTTLTLTGRETAGVRNLARLAAGLAGFEGTDATRVATSVSELARLAQRDLPATLAIAVELESRSRAPALVFELSFGGARRDRSGPDADPAYAVLSRLMDEVVVEDDHVRVSKFLPAAIDSNRATAIRDELLVAPRTDLGVALQGQNDELVATLIALRERESELVRLNSELEQTNRGVVALYAQLEERAAEVRNAQRVVFEELERALRPPPPALSGLELGVRYVPAEANSPTGGDLYDWFVMPGGALHVTIVDVQGHGVQSTRDALLVTHAVRTLALEGHQPAEILARTDRLLRTSGAGVVATALLARIDPVTGLVELAGAGHPPALHLPGTDEPEWFEAPGRPLGYPEAGSVHLSRYQLEPGDHLLMYTDGLVEIRHDIVEGMDTLAAAANKARHLAIPQLLDTVLAACSHGDLLLDDTLLLAVRRPPA